MSALPRLLDRDPAFDDFAWFVGVFEGEGCIYTRSKKDRKGNPRPRSLRLQVAMTDEDIVQRVFAFAQCGCVHGPVRRHATWKPSWEWIAEGKPASDLLVRMLPYLGERRRDRSLDALVETGYAISPDQLHLGVAP